jgi:hypothetical protein
MAYNSLVPTTGNTPAQDYVAIQGNFAQIAASYNTDHVALSGGTPQGFHKQVSLSTFGSAGAISGNQSYLYASNASGAGSQLVYQPSIVAFSVPSSPKAMFRITYNGAAWAAGSGIAFNFGSVAGAAGQPQVTFANVLADTNYFVSYSLEKTAVSTPGATFVTSKAVGSFVIYLETNAAANDSISIMVY